MTELVELFPDRGDLLPVGFFPHDQLLLIQDSTVLFTNTDRNRADLVQSPSKRATRLRQGRPILDGDQFKRLRRTFSEQVRLHGPRSRPGDGDREDPSF